MKTQTKIFAFLLWLSLMPTTKGQLTFSLSPASGTLTCSQPSLQVQALSNSTGQVSYTVIPSASVTGSLIGFTNPGTYTVIGASIGMGYFQQTITISQNIAPPSLTGSVTQAICGSTVAVANITTSPTGGSITSIQWQPMPLSLNASSTMANYVISPGPGPITITVTVQGSNGCATVQNMSINPSPPYPAFTTNFASPSTSITCTNTSVVAQAVSNYTYGSLSYTWNGAAANYTGQQVSINLPGAYTVTACDPVTQCCAPTQIIFIGQNTIAPTSTVSPQTTLLGCTITAIQTVTGIATPNSNVQHQFLWSYGGSAISNGTMAIVLPACGTHTYVVTNLVNGCKVFKTFTVACMSGFPTFSLASPMQNFSVGCAPKHTADVVFQNANTDPPGGMVSYTLFPITPSGSYTTGPQTNYTLNVPGQYIAVVRDIISGCESKTQFSIVQDTVKPHAVVSVPIRTLTCFTSSVLLSGSSTAANTSYLWIYNGGSGTVSVPGGGFTVNTSANNTSTIAGSYTFQVTDNNNACKSQTIVPIYQNIFPPHPLILGPTGSSTAAITCTTPVVILQNASTSGILSPPFPQPVLPVISTAWYGPAPQASLSSSSTYSAFIPGNYTMNVQDMNNGCVSTTVLTVMDHRDYPAVNQPVSAPTVYTVACPGITTASVNVTSSVNLVYTVFGPSGPYPAQIYTGIPGMGTIIFSLTSQGIYTVLVSNTVTGCADTTVLQVYGCVGLDEWNSNISSVLVFPNPIENEFSIGLKGETLPLTVKVYNSLSQEVLHYTLEQAGESIPFIAPSGVYYMTLAKEGRVLYYAKLVKK